MKTMPNKRFETDSLRRRSSFSLGDSMKVLLHAGLVLLLITACSERKEPAAISLPLPAPEQRVETSPYSDHCKNVETTTRVFFPGPDGSIIEATAVEYALCAITMRTGHTKLVSYERKPDGKLGSVRWKQKLSGPYVKLGDPRWHAPDHIAARMLVVYTGAESNFNPVYQYVNARTGERLVLSEPPALVARTRSGEFRLAGVRNHRNILHLGEPDPEIKFREKEHCSSVRAILEYGSDERVLDSAFLISIKKGETDWSPAREEQSSTWSFSGKPTSATTLSELIEGRIVDISGLAVQFEMFSLNNGQTFQLRVPIVSDRFHIEQAILPEGTKLTRDVDGTCK